MYSKILFQKLVILFLAVFCAITYFFAYFKHGIHRSQIVKLWRGVEQNAARFSQNFDFDRKSKVEIVHLKHFSENFSSTNQQIFFTETGFRSTLRGRQLCSIESAILNSGLRVKVLMTKNYLEVKQNSVISNFLYNYYPEIVDFYYIDAEEILKNTPLEGISKTRITQGKYRGNHLSDFVRHALIYKFGG